MEPMLCCSYAAADGSWIAWESGAEEALCTPRCLGPAAAAPAGSTPGWLRLPEAQKVRFLSRVNPEQPELADLCLQVHAGGESQIWEDAWLRPQKGLTWEGVEAFAESFADGWTFSVRAAAGEEKRLYLFSVRRDGLVCLRAGTKRAVILTKPLLCTADALTLNCATSAAGSVRVRILLQNGQPVCARSTEDCDVLYGNDCRIPVSFRGQRTLGGLTGQMIRLKFELQDAELYSFRFCTPK